MNTDSTAAVEKGLPKCYGDLKFDDNKGTAIYCCLFIALINNELNNSNQNDHITSYI